MAQTTYHIRVAFSSYEKSYLTEYLHSYLAEIKRHNPLANLSTPDMTSHHELVMFDSPPQTQISAFQLFQLKIELIHSFQPSEIYFSAYLKFPDSFHLLNPYQTDDSSGTLLPLCTQNEKYPIPSIYPQHQSDPIILNQLSLNLNMEQLQYSQSPYSVWKQVESQAGNIYFPDHQSLLHSLPSVQNPPPNHQIHKHPVRWNQRFHPRDTNDFSDASQNHHPPFKTPWKNNPPPPIKSPIFDNNQFNEHQHQQPQQMPTDTGTIPKLTNQYLQQVVKKITTTLNEQKLSNHPTVRETQHHPTSRPGHQLPRNKQFHPTDLSTDLSLSEPSI
jgi:hypothetical protein